TITSTDQRNASTHGSQRVRGRHVTPGWPWGVTFTRPVCSCQRGLGTRRRWPDYGRIAALNIVFQCIAVNSVPPGHQAYEPVADARLYHSTEQMVTDSKVTATPPHIGPPLPTTAPMITGPWLHLPAL